MQDIMKRSILSPLYTLELCPYNIPRVNGLSIAKAIIIMLGVVIIFISSLSTFYAL